MLAKKKQEKVPGECLDGGVSQTYAFEPRRKKQEGSGTYPNDSSISTEVNDGGRENGSGSSGKCYFPNKVEEVLAAK